MATKRWYRSKNGELLGVCKGLADWKDFPVRTVRLIFIIVAVCTYVVPCLIIYVLLAFILPVNPYEDKVEDSDGRSFKSRVKNRCEDTFERASRVVKSSEDDYVVVDEEEKDIDKEFERLKKKAEDINSRPIDKEEDWDNRFNQGN